MTDDYTRPELGVERELCRAIREAVVDAGGCRYCRHRARLFDTEGSRAACGLEPPRAFPACLDQQQGFEFDQEAYRRCANAELSRDEPRSGEESA